jgi:hypothetical protein
MNSIRIKSRTGFLAIIATSLVVVLLSIPKPQVGVGLREIGRAITSGAALYSVLSRLSEDQFSTNWPNMVILSQADLVPLGNIPREFVSDYRSGSNVIVTNRTGSGGWYFDVREKSLRLNLTNSVSFKLGRKIVALPPDYLVIDQSGVRLSIGNEPNADLVAYLNDVRAKADLILEIAQPSNGSQKQPIDGPRPK